MDYYRYRSGSELSIKELIYDEIYFASATECNDPYEGKMFAILGKDLGCWERLIHRAIDKYPGIQNFSYISDRIIDFYWSRAPLYVDEVLETDRAEFLNLANNDFEKLIYSHLLEIIKEFVRLYIPAEKYFVSFSKRNDISLMWAHYANNHRGYCAVFRVPEGKIKQNPTWAKKGISHQTPKSFSPQMTSSIDEAFPIRDIEYLDKPHNINGFMCFPPVVIGKEISEEEQRAFVDERSGTYFQKHKVWEYEEEARIVLSSGIPWLSGERTPLSEHQRLFHYDSTQLTGIVLGAKMPQPQRNRIKEIIAEKVDHWYSNITEERIISDFVLFEERLMETNRTVEVIPQEIYSASQIIKSDDLAFDKIFKAWQDGEAIRFQGNRAEKVRII